MKSIFSGGKKTIVEQFGKTNTSELMTELRHKYLTILKSNYWENFEEGQCSPESVLILIDSVDQCMDDETIQMVDWDFIQNYLMDDNFVKFMSWLTTMPIIGKYFYHYVYEHFSLSYDVIVNFIGAHEAAENMLKSVIESK